jgi:hypothetical protein
MKNSEYFEEVLGWFKNPTFKTFATQYVDLFPPYFSDKPASSSGKYHAPWSNIRGGLRAHTYAVCYMVHSMSDAYMLGDTEHDAALIAALGHDAVKYGLGGGPHTTKTHEGEGAIFFKRVVEKLGVKNFPLFQEIYDCIAFHQGRWAVSETPKRFPDDFTPMMQLVHVADMCASRPQIRFNFLENSMIG